MNVGILYWCCRLRAQFGKDILANAVHGPNSTAGAENMIKLIFGDVQFDEEGSLSGFHYFLPCCVWSTVLQCFDTVSWASGEASSLQELGDEVLVWLSVRSEVQIVCIWSS